MCSSNYILIMVLSSWIHSLNIHAYLSARVSYRIDCLFKLNWYELALLIGFIFIMIISPRILKGSWRTIMIVSGVRLFVRLFFVCFIVCNAFCPLMISLNDWRYEIFVLMSRCATAKKISKKVVFSASGDFLINGPLVSNLYCTEGYC